MNRCSLSGCGYNDFQKLDEETRAAWSEVLNQYQRRTDLVPNLVATVRGEASFEQETLTKVIEARAKATSMQVSPEILNNPEAIKKFQDAQGQLGSALSRLMVVSEQYPSLKANQAFGDLRVQLEGTENRITVARNRYIKAVQAYNTLLLGQVLAQDVLPVPALSGHLMDRSGTLSAADQIAIEQQLSDIEQHTGAQVVVLMVPSTSPEDIFGYANRVANTWKIGRKTAGDGVLVVVAVQDRRLRIEVAKSLEGALPDLAASNIIERDMTPSFKRGDYAAGLRQGIASLGQRIAGENLPAPEAQDSGTDRSDMWSHLLIGLFLISQWMRSLLGRGVAALLTGIAGAGLAYLLTANVWIALGAALVAVVWTFFGGLNVSGWGSGRGSGGLGGFSGRSGGFSSGGGGDFGGGGASGRW